MISILLVITTIYGLFYYRKISLKDEKIFFLKQKSEKLEEENNKLRLIEIHITRHKNNKRCTVSVKSNTQDDAIAYEYDIIQSIIRKNRSEENE